MHYAYYCVQQYTFRSFPDVNRPIMLLAVTTVEVNVSFLGYHVSLGILVIFRSDQTLLFVVEEPRPLRWIRTSHRRRHVGRYFPTKLSEGYRRLDEGSTTQTQAHIHLYTAPKLPRKVNRRLEPKPSARIVELPIKVELISKHYKCFVITVILWKHMARSNENDSYSLTTTHYLAGRLQTFWIYSAYMADSRPFEGHRLSPTHRFQVGSRTLRVYCPFCFSTRPEK